MGFAVVGVVVVGVFVGVVVLPRVEPAGNRGPLLLAGGRGGIFLGVAVARVCEVCI